MEDIIREEVSQVDIFHAACRIYCSFGTHNHTRHDQKKLDSENLDRAINLALDLSNKIESLLNQEI